MRGGVVDALLLPAPTRRRAGAVDRPLAPRRGPRGHRPGRSCSGWRAAIAAGAALGIAMHLSAPRPHGAAPARDRLAGRAGAGDRAAVHPRARLRPRAEGADGRARLLLPGRRSTSTTGCATSTRTRASCCARSTPRAGRRCACSRRPSALPDDLHRRQDRRRGRRHRRRVRRVGGLGPRARPHAADRQRPARDARARSPPPSCSSRSPSPSTALFALLERRVVDWTPRTAPQGGP